jgi:phosphoglucosamine mutase
MGNQPDGKNINDNCGTEHPQALATLMKQTQAIVGIAHDSHGDRAIIFDPAGGPIDRDILVGMVAGHLLKTNRLPNKAMITTIESNQSLDQYFQSVGINAIRYDVGERNVYQTMVRNHCYFRDENSRHLIFRKVSPVGDGIVAALFRLAIVTGKSIKLSELQTKIAIFSQKSFNVFVNTKVLLSDIQNLNEDVEDMLSKFPSPHRVLFRYSGTELKLQLLIEAPDEEMVDDAWKHLDKLIINRMTDNGISASIL